MIYQLFFNLPCWFLVWCGRFQRWWSLLFIKRWCNHHFKKNLSWIRKKDTILRETCSLALMCSLTYCTIRTSRNIFTHNLIDTHIEAKKCAYLWRDLQKNLFRSATGRRKNSRSLFKNCYIKNLSRKIMDCFNHKWKLKIVFKVALKKNLYLRIE